jgi:hypothetical protein
MWLAVPGSGISEEVSDTSRVGSQLFVSLSDSRIYFPAAVGHRAGICLALHRLAH